MEILDISRALSSNVAEWPGDTPFRFELKWKMAEGATVNVGAVNMGVHNGTHADAIFHFEPKGASIERMPLEAYLGAAVVIDLSDAFAGAVRREIAISDLVPYETEIAETRRLLLKTNCWRDSSVFPDWIPVMASDVAPWLATKKVQLLGLDVPSVDAIEAKQLSNHHALAAANIAIIEALDLTSADAGLYRFAALPVKITGGDGAPVRAVLWRDET